MSNCQVVYYRHQCLATRFIIFIRCLKHLTYRKDYAHPMSAITRERPDTFDTISLITDWSRSWTLYPSESRHGFSVDKLLAEDVAFSRCAQTRRRVVAASNWGGVWRDQADVCASTISWIRVRKVDAQSFGRLCPCSQHHVAALRNWDSPARSNRALRVAGLLPHSPFGPYTNPLSRCAMKRLTWCSLSTRA